MSYIAKQVVLFCVPVTQHVDTCHAGRNSFFRFSTCSDMESWTREANIYLSCLLDDVTGTEGMVAMRKDYCRIHDCLSLYKPVNAYFTGSKAEGLDLPGSDEDYMYDINIGSNIEVSESRQGLVNSTRANKFLVVPDNVRPGFVRLKLYNHLQSRDLPLHNRTFPNCLIKIDDSAYLSSQLYMSGLLALSQNRQDGYTVKVQGPSLETRRAYIKESQEGDDYVSSIRCNFWPTSATEWIGRPRQHGWPSSQDKESIIAFGCHLVPIGHPLSTAKPLQWRISFSIAERILVWSFNHTQMQCYAVMKLILKEFVKVRCTQRHKGVLCSYFIKTFLFWMYEAKNPSFWQNANLKECLTYLFQEFYTCIENGMLRHYFIPRFNLLEIKLTPDAQIELLTHFRALIDGGISMIGRCSSLSGVWSNFCQRRERNETEEHMREMFIHQIYIKDNYLIGKVLTTIGDVLQTPKFFDYRVSKGKLLITIENELQDNAFSDLLLLTKISICLYTNIELLNCPTRGNKSRYKNLKFLDSNVFGSD